MLFPWTSSRKYVAVSTRWHCHNTIKFDPGQHSSNSWPFDVLIAGKAIRHFNLPITRWSEAKLSHSKTPPPGGIHESFFQMKSLIHILLLYTPCWVILAWLASQDYSQQYADGLGVTRFQQSRNIWYYKKMLHLPTSHHPRHWLLACHSIHRRMKLHLSRPPKTPGPTLQLLPRCRLYGRKGDFYGDTDIKKDSDGEPHVKRDLYGDYDVRGALIGTLI